MLKAIVTEAIVSRGYDGAPALKIIQGEKGDIVHFRTGSKVYDSRAENNTRWVNLSVKAFGYVCERIKKMQLKEGSYINMIGRLDEESWEDQNTHEKKKAMVLIVEEIEYCYSNNNKQADSSEKPEPTQAPTQTQNATPENTPPAEGFTGYEAFGGANSFFG